MEIYVYCVKRCLKTAWYRLAKGSRNAVTPGARCRRSGLGKSGRGYSLGPGRGSVPAAGGSEIYHRDLVPGVGQEFMENIRGSELQGAGTDTGVAAQKFRLIDLALHQQTDLVAGVVHQPQDCGGARGTPEQFPEVFLRRKGEAGGTDLMTQVLGVEGFVGPHAQQVELSFLPVAQKEILADGRAKYLADSGTLLHVVGGVPGNTVVFNTKGFQQVESGFLLRE